MKKIIVVIGTLVSLLFLAACSKPTWDSTQGKAAADAFMKECNPENDLTVATYCECGLNAFKNTYESPADIPENLSEAELSHLTDQCQKELNDLISKSFIEGCNPSNDPTMVEYCNCSAQVLSSTYGDLSKIPGELTEKDSKALEDTCQQYIK